MSRFDYVIEKVRTAPKVTEPFEHIYIEDLFSPDDFEQIVGSREIRIDPANDDEDLFAKLFDAGYKVIDFPGCIVDKKAYINWHRNKRRGSRNIHTACEGFGMTLRLIEPEAGILAELNRFLASEPFNRALAERVGVDLAECNIDGGIQKYLGGYEISPHPDIRSKAATFMVNINPNPASEEVDHHTHYLWMKPEYEYVSEFWEQNADAERCWVPWDWCETRATQPRNNSMVIFSPADNTMHGVKADYDHLAGQRTQLYGNLWYMNRPKPRDMQWEQLADRSFRTVEPARPALTLRDIARSVVPANVRQARPRGDYSGGQSRGRAQIGRHPARGLFPPQILSTGERTAGAVPADIPA